MNRHTAEIKGLKDLNKESVTHILQSHFGRADVKVVDIGALNELGGVNDAWQSEIKKAAIRYKLGASDATEEMHVIVKLPAKNFMKFIHKVARPFLFETLWYSRDVPNLDNDTMETMTPQCYFAHYEGVDEIPKAPRIMCAMMCAMMPHNKPEKGILILEDISMTDSKFKHLDKNKIPDIEDFLVVMEALAHFHGIWWQVLRDLRVGGNSKQTDMDYKQFKRHFQHKFGGELGMKTFDWFGSFLQGLAKLLENRNLHPELALKLSRYDTGPAIKKLFNIDSSFTTVVHGDLWTNNFMMSQDGRQIKFIDFGNVFLSHPAYDIVYFLYMNTDREFRKKHEEEILKKYFATFSKYLRGENGGFDQFRREVAEKREAIMLIGMATGTGVLNPHPMKIDHTLTKTMDEYKKKELPAKDNPNDHEMMLELRRRLIGFIEDMRDLGFL